MELTQLLHELKCAPYQAGVAVMDQEVCAHGSCREVIDAARAIRDIPHDDAVTHTCSQQSKAHSHRYKGCSARLTAQGNSPDTACVTSPLTTQSGPHL